MLYTNLDTGQRDLVALTELYKICFVCEFVEADEDVSPGGCLSERSDLFNLRGELHFFISIGVTAEGLLVVVHAQMKVLAKVFYDLLLFPNAIFLSTNHCAIIHLSKSRTRHVL